jgi:NADH-quinone oxidoreductase subunit D
MMHYLLRDREKILDLFELVSGARYSHSYLRVGGVCLDVTDGFLERVLESGELIQIRLKEFNDLFTFNQTFQQRTCEIGGIDKEILIRNGSTGPNARAAGLEFDVRRAHPYASYEAYDFMASIPRESDEIWSDSHGRYLIRIKEISQSLDILKQAVHSIPSGPFLIKAASPTFIPKSGEAYSRVESIRGMLGCYVVSDGGAKPNRVQFRTPTGAHLACIPQALSGARIEDFPVILASMDIGMHEVDK